MRLTFDNCAIPPAEELDNFLQHIYCRYASDAETDNDSYVDSDSISLSNTINIGAIIYEFDALCYTLTTIFLFHKASNVNVETQIQHILCTITYLIQNNLKHPGPEQQHIICLYTTAKTQLEQICCKLYNNNIPGRAQQFALSIANAKNLENAENLCKFIANAFNTLFYDVHTEVQKIATASITQHAKKYIREKKLQFLLDNHVHLFATFSSQIQTAENAYIEALYNKTATRITWLTPIPNTPSNSISDHYGYIEFFANQWPQSYFIDLFSFQFTDKITEPPPTFDPEYIRYLEDTLALLGHDPFFNIYNTASDGPMELKNNYHELIRISILTRIDSSGYLTPNMDDVSLSLQTGNSTYILRPIGYKRNYWIEYIDNNKHKYIATLSDDMPNDFLNKLCDHYPITHQIFTLLFHAAAAGNAKSLIDFLIERKIDVNVIYKNQWTALMLAVINESTEAIKSILDTGRADINAINTHGCSALILAGLYRKIQPVIELLNNPNCAAKIDLNLTNCNGDTALTVVCDQPDVRFLQELLKPRASGSQININKRTRSNNTPLSLAVIANRIETVMTLTTCADIDLSIRHANKHSILHIAAGIGDVEIFKLLLIAGKQFNTAQKNKNSTLKLDINAKNNLDETALMIAARVGHTPIVVALLTETDTDLFCKNIHGVNALWLAQANNHMDIYDLLITAMHQRPLIERIANRYIPLLC